MKIDPAAIAFDVDGVVADTMHLMLAVASGKYGLSQLRYEDITCYELSRCLDIREELLADIIADLIEGSYTFPLAPMDGAVAVLQRLVQHRNPLLFVTARPYPGPMETWLPDTLGLPSRQIDIVSTGAFDAKVEVLLERGVSWFVEDRLDTCFLLNDAGITPVLYCQPWNREAHPFVEIASWSELDRLIAW